MPHQTDSELILKTRNSARFSVEHRTISCVLMVTVLAWGLYAYRHMPKRKDPEIPVLAAMAVCRWPGANAQQVEQLVTRKIEARIAENSDLQRASPGGDYGIRSLSVDGLSVVQVLLEKSTTDPQKIFTEINVKLHGIHNLPNGAGPIEFISDFGETAALMLTFASPPEDDIVIRARADNVRNAVIAARQMMSSQEAAHAVAVIVAFPPSLAPESFRHLRDAAVSELESRGSIGEVRMLDGQGFAGFDAGKAADERELQRQLDRIWERFGNSSFDPDSSPPVIIRDPGESAARLAAVAGAKYTYRQLDMFTDLAERTLSGVPQVSKVRRRGVIPEQILLEYSQVRLSRYGLQLSGIQRAIAARNITSFSGEVQLGGVEMPIYASGRFHLPEEIGSVAVSVSPSGSPVYLRDLVDISRSYPTPPAFLNFYTAQNASGRWQNGRAITLAVYMRSGSQIEDLSEGVKASLEALKKRLPSDLIIARTSDQARQARENLDVFMSSLYEAIVLVILCAFVGFGEWRSALVVTLSIPLTLATALGMADLLQVDIQQVSIATLIVALGLLVDDPVVAGDAIKTELSAGQPSIIAAWLGPTKLARAILFATVTNVAAYLPFLLLTGNTGKFLRSLPIVMTCALVASRVVSMTFVPALGYYFQRPRRTRAYSAHERRSHGISGAYYRVGVFSIHHRWLIAVLSLGLLGIGYFFRVHLKTAFFPDDVQYLSYVDLWLPNSATLREAQEASERARSIIQGVAGDFFRRNRGVGSREHGLRSMTTFVGGGGPRFWFSVSPEPPQLNYAQLVLELGDKEYMPAFATEVQAALERRLVGAVADVQQLQINPVSRPIEIFLSARADDDPVQEKSQTNLLRRLTDELEQVFRDVRSARRVRDNWGSPTPALELQIDPDRAALAHLSNQDIATSVAAAASGVQLGAMLEANQAIPIVARLRREERGAISDLSSLYVYSSGGDRVPLSSVAALGLEMETSRIIRRNHFRTVSVVCFPAAGVLPSEVMKAARAGLEAFERRLPQGFTMAIGGSAFKQKEGFGELGIVLIISALAIFVALVIQFDSVVKPLLVFAAVPYGAVGALAALYIMNAPFGFMAYFGIASLVGVIVSHVIVLFDFIEQNREKGEPLIDSLLDAGIARLRAITITVATTVLALFPLALHGGPLWKPLCYSQIGGLIVATVVELLLVKVFYAICVLDLRLIAWTRDGSEARQMVNVERAAF